MAIGPKLKTFLAVLLALAVGTLAAMAYTQFRGGASETSSTLGYVREPVPWVGMDVQEVTNTVKEALELNSTDGVLVSRVLKNSPAEAAGIATGDVITRFARQRVPNTAIMQTVLASLSVGDTIKANIIRDGSRKTFYVTITSRPPAVSLIAATTTAALTGSESAWGMVISPLGAGDLAALGLPKSVKGGVYVVQVLPSGLARAAGVLSGDVIVKVNDKKVEDLEIFYKQLGKSDDVVLTIYRDGVERVISLNAAGATLPLVRIAGMPSTDDTSDADGYQGKPLVIPPMGSATAGSQTDTSSNRSSVCICLYCGTQVTHPAGISCADLECPVCGQRMASPSAGIFTAGVPSAIPPMGQPTAGMPTTGVPAAIPPLGQPTAGMPTAGMPTAGVPSAIPPMGQPTAGMPTAGMPTAGMPTAGVPSAIPPMGQPTAGMPTAGMPTAGVPSAIPPMGQPTAGMPTAGMPTAGVPSAIPPLGQPVAGDTDTVNNTGPNVERPDNRPPPTGPELKIDPTLYLPVALTTNTGDTVMTYVPVGGQPDTIPPVGQTTGGQPDTIPPVGQTTGGQPDTIPPVGQTTGGQPDTIPPVGQTTGGQPDNIPPMGQTTTGVPSTIPPMGQATAGGAPVGTIPPSNLPNAGTTPSTSTASAVGICVCPVCLTTVYHPLGVPCSSLSCPVCGSRMINASAGQTTAGAPVATIPPSNLPGSSDDDSLPGSSGQGAANLIRNLTDLPAPTYALVPANTLTLQNNLVPTDPSSTVLYPRMNLGQTLVPIPTALLQQPIGTATAATTQGSAQGGAQGGTGGQQGAGPSGYCVCPLCGTLVEHVAGTPCTQVACPRCGSMMVRATGQELVAGVPAAGTQVAIAIAGSGLDSNLAVFETATNYIIIDVETGRAQIVPNPNAGDPSNSGSQSAQLVVDRGADVVIANSFTDEALKTLTQMRTQAMTSLFGSVQDAINSYFDMLRGIHSGTTQTLAANDTVEEEEEGKKYGLTKDRSSGKTKGDEESL